MAGRSNLYEAPLVIGISRQLVVLQQIFAGLSPVRNTLAAAVTGWKEIGTR